MNDLKTNKLQILRYFTLFMSFVGIMQIISLLFLIFYPKEYKDLYCFLIPGIIYLILGLPLSIILKKIKQAKLRKNEDSLILVLIWIFSSILASVPYIIKSGSFTKGMFEMISGFSTTGFTLFDETYGHLFIFYRSLSYLVGGIGIVLIFTSAFNDSFGLKLYTAEGHNDRLIANLVRSSRLFIGIYLGYMLLGFIAYLICGLNAFDALVYSMSAISTGGVATYGSNLNVFSKNRLAIEIITIILMILGSINFVIHTFILTAKFKKVWQHCETKLYIFLSVIFIFLITFSLVNILDYKTTGAIRVSIFQYFSAISGTGFQSVDDLKNMGSVMYFLLIISMLIGGGVGSCSAGIKQYRICLMLKSMHWNFLEMNSSKNVIIPHYINRYDKKILVSDKDIISNYFFIINYILIFILGSLILTLCHFDFTDSLFTFASALGNVGFSRGFDFNNVSNFILWFFILAMFIGRLEIFVVFKAIFRIHSDIKNKI